MAYTLFVDSVSSAMEPRAKSRSLVDLLIAQPLNTDAIAFESAQRRAEYEAKRETWGMTAEALAAQDEWVEAP